VEQLFSLRLASVSANLTEVENQIETLLEHGNISDAVYGNVIVALTEATLNAIKHGNKGDSSKNVLISASISDKEVEFIVEDEGLGFNHVNLPDPTDPANLEKVNGRGIFIISNLTDNLEFKKNGAKLIMSFSLNVNEGVVA